MKRRELIGRVRAVCRTQHKSLSTERSYLGWINRFISFAKALDLGLPAEIKVRKFLEAIAPNSAASTQNQALNAIAFLFNQVLETPLGDFGDWAKAQRPQRLPVWLTREEWLALHRHLSGTPKIMAEFCYGSGLRLMEVVRLRVKDVDLSSRVILVREGKGKKDRVTCLPAALSVSLNNRLASLRQLWEEDQCAKIAGVQLPDTLEGKYPNAGKEWPWQWMFPSARLSRDPRSGIVRRHHLSENALQKAVTKAARLARLTKRVTTHALRHSFATELLQNGVDIVKIQDLLGHEQIETTSIYLHCIPKFACTVTSPLDLAQQSETQPQIVPFRASA